MLPASPTSPLLASSGPAFPTRPDPVFQRAASPRPVRSALTIRTTFALAALLTGSILTAARPVHAQEALRLVPSNLVEPDELPAGAGSGAAPAFVRIVGARNGAFSGKLLAGAAKVIEDLHVVPGDLAMTAVGANGTPGPAIPAAAVRIRYGMHWDAMRSFVRPQGLDILVEAPPPGQKVAAVWITVAIPKDQPPGDYAGSSTVSARGAAPVAVPVRLHVADWTLPDPAQYTTWLELVQSPDTLSAEYDLPLWSEKHWKMIEQSFALIGAVGTHVVYAPLICQTNMGNAESMVRWLPRADGSWDYDFTILEKYLDTAEKHLGRPKVVVFNVWDVYQQDKALSKSGRGSPLYKEDGAPPGDVAAPHVLGPAVTVQDAAGNVTTRHLPLFSEPGGAVPWAPLFTELHKRMAKRGLKDVIALGMLTDVVPTPEDLDALKGVSGGLPWVCHAHFEPGTRGKYIPETSYVTFHENVVVTLNPALGRTYGWQDPALRAVHPRGNDFGRLLPSAARCLLETQITGKQRGYGYTGGDIWWAFRDKRGQRVGSVIDRYPASYWRNLEMRIGLLAPGPDGPVASVRYENVREGLQECEARIFLERALTDPAARGRLGEDLATRAQALLDERQHALWREKGLTDEEILSVGTTAHWMRALSFNPQQRGRSTGDEWFRASGWQDRNQRLFDLAGEAGKKLAAQ